MMRSRPGLAPGEPGRWFAACSATFLLTGILGDLPASSALGAFGFLTLLVLAQRARTLIFQASRGALRVRWSEPNGLRTTAGRPTPVSFALTGPLAPLVDPEGLTPGVAFPTTGHVESRAGRPVLVLSAPRVGHTWVQGYLATLPVGRGIWMASAWIPAPLHVGVLPSRFPLGIEGPGRSGPATLMTRQAARNSKHPGFGMDLRELRDHQPGDPFKQIAWSATARRGKLTSRVYESDIRRSTWILLDVSPSMFWGEPGFARIDYGIETAFQLITLLLDRSDRVGLLLHDEHVRFQVAPGIGKAQHQRLLRALLEVSSLLHEDRTEVTHRELLDAVGDWFAAQEMRRFRLPLGLREMGWVRYGTHDEARLLAAARTRLREATAARAPLLPATSYSTDPRRAVFRAFCRHHGVTLPLDPNPRPGAQALGLERALRSVLSNRQGPHNVLLISDLHTADHLESLRRVAQAARKHRHQIVVLCPHDLAFESVTRDTPSPARLSRALDAAHQAKAAQSLQTFEAFLRPAGVSMIRCREHDAVPRIVQKLNQLP